MDTPKVGDLLRMTEDTSWYPGPRPPYDAAQWQAGTTFRVTALGTDYGTFQEFTIQPLMNDQQIRIDTGIAGNRMEPV